MNDLRYLTSVLEHRFSYAFSGIVNVKSAIAHGGVFEVPSHPSASRVIKWRCFKANGMQVLCGKIELDTRAYGTIMRWYEFAIAKSREALKVWKDLHCT